MQRGHRVTFLTTHHFREPVQAAGARFLEYTSVFEDFDVPSELKSDNPEEKMHLVWLHENIAILRAAERLLAADIPDLVVYDVMPFIAGRLLARKWGRPAVMTSPVFASNKHYSIWDELNNANGFRPLYEMESARCEMQELLAEYGIRTPADEFWYEPEGLTLVFISRSYQPYGDTFDERTLFIGPSYPQGRGEPVGQWQRPEGHLPVIVISLGTMFNDRPDVFRICLEALGGRPWHVVLAVGPFKVSKLGREIPPNIKIRRIIPFVQVLKQASAFITHGSIGASVDSLYWGCPLVIWPGIGTQYEPSADRLVELGLGYRLQPEDINAEGLSRAVEAVVNDTAMRERAVRMGEELRQAGGAPRAADAIEAYLGGAISG